MNKTLIIGKGEIGNALKSIFEKEYKTIILDKNETTIETNFVFMHVCFPYSNEFENQVKQYKKLYKPKYAIIHSTVPVGTSKKLCCWHSPVVGIHPHLQESLKTFTKFIGGKNNVEIYNYFKRTGMKIYLTDKSETTELMKISSTTYYGLCIEYTKEIKKQCNKLNIPFELWTIWTNNYNQGYKKLGYNEYIRPNLIPTTGKIGGHCVVQNTSLLNNKFTMLIKDLNK